MIKKLLIVNAEGLDEIYKVLIGEYLKIARERGWDDDGREIFTGRYVVYLRHDQRRKLSSVAEQEAYAERFGIERLY